MITMSQSGRDPSRYLYVGVDVHKDTHTAVAATAFQQPVFSRTLPNCDKEYARLISSIARIANQKKLQVIWGLEDTQSYGKHLAQYLHMHNLTVKTVSPVFVDHIRKHTTHPEKSDLIDAQGVAEVLIQRIDRLPTFTVTDTGKLATTLRELCGDRAFLVQEGTRLKNQLHHLLYEAYGSVYQHKFKKLFSVKALRYWHRYPVPVSMKDNCMLKNRIRRKVKRLQQLRTEIKELESDLVSLLQQTEQHLETLSGCGVVLASVVLGEIGDINNFHSPHALAKYAGLAPREYSSGKRIRHRQTHAGNRQLNRAIHRIALSQISKSGNDYAKAYYQRKLSEGKTKMHALRCLKRRLVKIIYMMLKYKQEYQYATGA